jgi:PhnB protein
VVDAIPKDYRTITPYLLVTGVPALLEFLQKALDATVLKTEVRDDGTIMHAEVRIGNSMLMTGEASADFAPMPASIYLYVEDCDAVYQRALNAGGSIVFPISDLPSGERYGGVRDGSGNVWWIATHVEDVSDDEQRKRWAAFKK